MGLSGFLFIFLQILSAGRCLIKENTHCFAGDNLPAYNREQHTGAPSDLQKQASNGDSVGLQNCLSLHACLEASTPRCGLSCPYSCLLPPQNYLNALRIGLHLNSTWTPVSEQAVAEIILQGVPSC